MSTEATDVLLRGGRIAAIGRGISRDTLGSGEVLEGEGRYLAPGLIDGHTHLNEIPGMTFEHEAANPHVARDARRQIPRSYLYYGFTTVIDLNSVPSVIAEWNEQDVRPHAYFCGAAPLVNAYPMRFMPKAIRYQMMPYFLFDQARPDDFPDGICPRRPCPGPPSRQESAATVVSASRHTSRGASAGGEIGPCRPKRPFPTSQTPRAITACRYYCMPIRSLLRPSGWERVSMPLRMACGPGRPDGDRAERGRRSGSRCPRSTTNRLAANDTGALW